MISQCMNPECRRELRYLRDGRVIRIVHHNRKQVTVEHFWLCGNCHLNYDFNFSANGEVSLTRKPKPVAPQMQPAALTLVA